MITRKKSRIDYQRFNAAGVLSYISSDDDEAEIEELSLSLESCSIIESSTMANAKKVMITIDVLKSDILDLIDETPENASMDMGVVEKLEGMRSMYRAKNLELISMGVDNDDDDGKRYKEECDTTLAQIKDYIKKVKYLLSVKDDKKEEIKQKENSILFLAEHTEIRITELNTIFGRKISQASDEELLSWKGEMVENDRRFESVAEKYQKLLKFPATNIKTIETVKRIGLRYELLSSSKTRYETSLTQTVIERELDKKNLFRESNLNIQLPKFSGYESSIDIYTFQSEFEKVYAHKTPTYLLPDLLINNFISEPALSLVKGLQKINEIWVRLKQAYGDTKFIIMKRLNLVCAMESISKKKDPEKIMYMLSKMVNAIKDLMRIASEHNIENHLYYGDGLQRIYKVLDEARVTRWLVTICEENLDEEDKWKRLLLFLEKEMKVQQQKALLQGNKVNQKETDDGKFTFKKNSRYNHSYFAPSESASNNHEEIICHICGQSPGSSDHVVTAGPNGSKVIQYFSCKTFVDKNPAERFAVLKSKNLCFQCLLPGADAMTGKHKEGKCQHDFTCKHAKHSNYTSKKHVLVCDEHKYDNTELLNTYKQRCMKNSNIPSFSRNIKLSFHSDAYHSGGVIKTEKTDEVGIYLLQRIKVNDQLVNVFFDNGCSDCVIKHATAKRLDSAASQVYDGRISIGGVGNSISESNHGIYSIKMPLYDGKVATLSAICLDQITFKFPTYPLEDVEKEIHVNYRKIGGDPNMLPRSSITVGGETDIMIGIKYLRYHPKPIFQLPSGLCIYESVFNNAQGGRGVIGGPHEIFSRIHQKFDSSKMRKSFFTHQQNITSILFNIDPDVSLIGFKDEIHTSNSNISEDEDSNNQVQVTQGFHSKYLQSEQVGSEINYRCINCRQCQVCKHHKQIEAVSIKEEVEQDVINKSISIDINNNVISAYLPFIQDPALKLAPNKNKALKVYFQQLRKLNHPQNIKDKEDIIQSELKLQKLGYVDYLKNLPQEIRNELQNHHIQNYIPWRAVWKVSSVSTPCRVVFDASQSTLSGFSLNDLLAKGQNNLNRLQEILIRWSSHKVAFTTDVKKMYNTVKLDVKDWCYQRYVWQDDLDPGKIPDEKIIKTLIYGVRSSGNQADRGLKELANLSEDKYPEASNIVKKDMYVDDCISGDVSKDLAIRRFEEIELILNKGGFQLKGVAISNEDPPQTLSDDGVSINVAGMIWFPKSDLISLCIPEMNFAKKNRGKKSSSMNRIIPENITRRHCASRVAEVFDITGKITPITASLKLDLHELVIRKLDWDDSIPDDLRPLWLSNFELINDIGNMKFQRAIVPVDAVDLKLDTVDFADASQSLVCSAIYARFKRKNGMYSSQLVFARSKIVPKDMSLPRAELYAALLNAHTGEIVRRSFRDIHQSSIKLTDSKITLHWITNDSRPLKEWVRNRVIEILRFTKKEQWFHVKGTDMLADIGTRRGKSLRDIDDASIWINGFDWMQNDCSSFPIKSPSDLIITEEAKSEISKERSIETAAFVTFQDRSNVMDAVQKRYQLSNYLIDPNCHRFRTVTRILGIVMTFIKKLRQRRSLNINQNPCKQLFVSIEDNEIKLAEEYYFKKCTTEVIHFMEKKTYEKFTKMKNGILFYSGRTLSTNDITVVGRYTNAMKDLTASTFHVPVIEKSSPVAYAIVSEIHWYHPTAKHCGIETTLRYVLQKAFIIEGRSIVKAVKKSCERCRYLEKRTVAVSMGPVSRHNLTIAPAYFASQVDLAGPFLSYSNHNKRATVKIWLVIFCCAVTSSTNIKVMEDYSTTSFIQAFTRFSCEVGYPHTLLCDEGSQLLKACQDMKLCFRDIHYQLHKDVKVNFEVCSVGGHNEHGKVERKIKEVKSSLEKTLMNERLSIIQWETIVSSIANNINNLPLAVGSITDGLETLDLITPNRLKLGRNNERSPTAPVILCNPLRTIEENQRIFDSWFENWLLVHVPKLLKQQKWYHSDDAVKSGDIVLFLENEGSYRGDYKYGIVKSVTRSKDGLARKACIQYKNNKENTFRETNRSIRSIVLIHQIDETNITAELGRIANNLDIQYSNLSN